MTLGISPVAFLKLYLKYIKNHDAKILPYMARNMLQTNWYGDILEVNRYIATYSV